MAEVEVSLSRRERQIMDAIYRRGHCSAAEVMGDMPAPPSYSAVRALLRILEDKGHLRHEKQGPRYVFYPVVSPTAARQSALKRVLNTFFGGSAEQAAAALLEMSSAKMSQEELTRLAGHVRRARTEGR